MDAREAREPADGLEVLVAVRVEEARPPVRVGLEAPGPVAEVVQDDRQRREARRARARAAPSARGRRRTRACRRCARAPRAAGAQSVARSPSPNSRRPWSPRRRAAPVAVHVERTGRRHADRGEPAGVAGEERRAGTRHAGRAARSPRGRRLPAPSRRAAPRAGASASAGKSSCTSRGKRSESGAKTWVCASTTIRLPRGTLRRQRVDVGRLEDPCDRRATRSARARAGRNPGPNARDGRDAGGELQVRRVGRAREHADRPLLAEHRSRSPPEAP